MFSSVLPTHIHRCAQIWDGETLDYRVSIAAHSVGITSIASCFITPPGVGAKTAVVQPSGSLKSVATPPLKPLHMTKGPIVFTGAADGSIRVRWVVQVVLLANSLQ